MIASGAQVSRSCLPARSPQTPVEESSRGVARARKALMVATRNALQERLELDRRDLQQRVGLVRSNLALSLSRAFGESESSCLQ